MLLADINPKVLILSEAVIFFAVVAFVILFTILHQRGYYRFLREKQYIQNSFQHEILKTQLETQEETFFQIGEEIHDNIGQLLSSTKMLLGITERNLPSIPDPFKTAQETLGKAIIELRTLSKSLNKEWLHQFNVIQNLETEIDRINSAPVLQIQLFTSVKILPLAPEAQVMLFRIIQEAIHNSLKHANATIIRITIDINDMILVTIANNGTRLPSFGKDYRGEGIIKMKHRTLLLGGTIEWQVNKDSGTEVKIFLPIQNMKYEN